MKFGGCDVAQRIDNTCLAMVQRNSNGILEEVGLRVWPHTKFGLIAQDIGKIQAVERMTAIGYDHTGIGTVAEQLFPSNIPKYPIISSAPMKNAIINFMNAMFSKNFLIIHSPELKKELLAQQKEVSLAGNILYHHQPGRHDDRLWAFGYACATAYMQYFQSLGIGASKSMINKDGSRNIGNEEFDMSLNF